MVGAGAVIAQAWLVSVAVAGVFVGGGGLAQVAAPLAGAACLAVVRVPLLWGSDALAQDAADRLKARLRADLTGRLIALGPAYADRERTGELVTVMTGGMDALDAYLTSYQPARWLAGAVPVLVLGVILVLDPPTVLVLVLTGPVLVLLLAMIGQRTAAATARRFRELRWLSAFFLDILQGTATLKAFGRSAEQVDTIRSMSRQYGDTTMEVLRTAFQASLVLEWGGAIAVALVAVEVSLRLMGGSLPFERALAVLIIVPEFFLPLRQLATRYHAGGAGRTAAERAFAILDSGRPEGGQVVAPARAAAHDRDDAATRADAATAPVPGADEEIRFEGVTFTYPDRVVPAVRALDLTIRAGETIALVGETGAGKTTVASLLLRFVEPDAGAILVGDRALASIEPGAWRARLAWVSQRPHMFDGTIGDNIRLAVPGASPDAVARAASEAGVDEFVRTWPLGLDTAIGERGERLSGGQRQRVALARAFLADARLVILDEVTSQLDPASEARIRDAIQRLSRGRAVLIVSHRMRLASVADRVVVLAHGRVVEEGMPDALAAVDGPYRRLLDAGRGSGDGA